VLVKHLLNIEGVNAAAYQVTRIDPPMVFIRIEDGKKIKNIIHKGIEALRKEVTEVEKLFSKLM
jgi:DNA-directed RNA polymerase subunit L